MINRSVVCNLVDPGREFELRTVARKRSVNLDEDFLRQIKRGIVVSHHSIDEGGDGALVSIHQFLKTSVQTSCRTGYELRIGSCSERHNDLINGSPHVAIYLRSRNRGCFRT